MRLRWTLLPALFSGCVLPLTCSATPTTTSTSTLLSPSVAAPVPQPYAPWWQSLLSLPQKLFSVLDPLQSTLGPLPVQAAAVNPCAVLPLPTVEDPDALAFEFDRGPGSRVDVSGLTPETAYALHRFERVVSAVGGRLALTSAYRPPAYQDHLRAVWEKWMIELRDNTEPGCHALRAEVQDEFDRHELLESQIPAIASDHTRGTAFDATVAVPRGARLRRRPVSVDGLARLCDLLRPAPVRDRVHFRLQG